METDVVCGRSLLSLLTVAACATIPSCSRKAELPAAIGTVPSFVLVDQDGKPFGSADLDGHVYVANFFFTRCPTICIPLMRSVARFQERSAEAGLDAIRIVSISVDPENDTPEVLRAYGAELGVDPSRWKLLTGDTGRVRELLEQGFMVHMGIPVDRADGRYDIAHRADLVLVDADGGIRGFHDPSAEGQEAMLDLAGRLLRAR